MLVMSRKEHQKIVFPSLGITLTILGVRGNSSRIGIEAPDHIRILREELVTEQPGEHQGETATPHSLRNVLNTVNLHTMLYQQQMDVGLLKEAGKTFLNLVSFLETQRADNAVQFQVESSGQPENRTLRVSLIEDDRNQRQLLTKILELQGLQVDAFDNGKEALTAMDQLDRSRQPDLIILDWAMPQFGGNWTVRQLLSRPEAERPKLFVVSGTDAVDEKTQNSVDAWLAKPLNQDLLFARLRAIHSAC